MVGVPGKFKYLYLALQAILLSYHVQSSPMNYNKIEQGAELISTIPADRAGLALEDQPKVSLGSNQVSKEAPVLSGVRAASPSISKEKLESQVGHELSLAGNQGKQELNSSPFKPAEWSIDIGVDSNTQDGDIIKFPNNKPEKEMLDFWETHADLEKEIKAIPNLMEAAEKLLQSSEEDLFENLKSLTDGFGKGVYGDDGDAALLRFLTHEPFKSNALIIWQHLQVFMAKSLEQNRIQEEEIEKKGKILFEKPVESAKLDLEEGSLSERFLKPNSNERGFEVENPSKRLAQLQTNEQNILHLLSTSTDEVVEKIESFSKNGQLSTFIANQKGLPGYLHQTDYKGGQEKIWLFWPRRIVLYLLMKNNPTFVKDTDDVICTSGQEQTDKFFHYLDKVVALDHEKFHSQEELAYIEFWDEWMEYTEPPFWLQLRFSLYVLARCDYKFWKHWDIGQKMTALFTNIASKLSSTARKWRALGDVLGPFGHLTGT